MLLAGCTVPTADSEAMERIMLWQITNLQQWGCATYLNGTSLFHRLTEHCSALSTDGGTVITNVTIETFGEASIHSSCACFPGDLCIVGFLGICSHGRTFGASPCVCLLIHRGL